MSKLTFDFINWVLLKCFNAFSISLVNSSLVNSLKEINAISWSKGDINNIIKRGNNNKMCEFDEYDIFTAQHWDLAWFITLWNAKSIYLFRKMLPLNSIMNLVTKLKLLSIVNITLSNQIEVFIYFKYNIIANMNILKQLNSYDVTYVT